MVNRGASKGCITCRKRRVKCDEARPFCRNCTRGGRECLGYATEQSSGFIFRNQTASIAKRYDDTGKQLVVANGHSSPRFDENAPFELVFAQCVPPTLVQDVRTQALTFFFKVFLDFGPGEREPGPWLDYLRPMYARTGSDSALHRTTDAVSLAILSKFHSSPPTEAKARREYVRALQKIGEGIASPEQSTTDELLMAVMMLSIYEVMSDDTSSFRSYSNHIRGATSLVRHRGLAQFNTSLSLKMFRAVRMQMIMAAIARCECPEEFIPGVSWLDDIPNAKPADDGSRMGLFQMEVANLRAAFRAVLTAAPTSSPFDRRASLEKAIREAQLLYQKLVTRQENFPEAWRARHFATWNPSDPPTPPPIDAIPGPAALPPWPGPIHAYSDLFIAYHNNLFRMLRLYTLDVWYKGLEALAICHGPMPNPLITYPFLSRSALIDDTSLASEHLIIRRHMQRIVDDVCASVPYHLGWRSGQAFLDDYAYVTLEGQAAKGQGAYFLTMPLWNAMAVPCIPPEQKAWMKNCLEMLADEFGMRQMKYLANVDPHMLKEEMILDVEGCSIASNSMG